MGPRSRIPVVRVVYRDGFGAAHEATSLPGKVLGTDEHYVPRGTATSTTSSSPSCSSGSGADSGRERTGGSAPARTTANRTPPASRGGDPVAMNNPTPYTVRPTQSRRVSARSSSGSGRESAGAGPESASPCCPGSVGARRHLKRPGSRRGAVAATVAAPWSLPRARAVHRQNELAARVARLAELIRVTRGAERQGPGDLDLKGA